MIFFGLRVATQNRKSPLTAEEWRKAIDEYERLRDLERADFYRDLQRLIADLKLDAAVLYRTGLRREVRGPDPDGFTEADYTASAIRRRLVARKYNESHLRFTVDNLRKYTPPLDRLEPEVSEVRQLRSQAWWLDAAAELALVWIALYQARRDELRGEQERGRGPSVGLDFFIGATLTCTTADIAEHLVDAKVLPERENDEDDPLAQWKQHLKKARQRYRRRYAR